MRHRKWTRTALRLVLFTSIMLAGIFVLFAVQRDPDPSALYHSTEVYLNLAREMKADLDAPSAYETASRTLGQARTAMMSQYGRPAFLRNYGQTRRLLLDAHKKTALAIDSARTESATRQEKLQAEISDIRADADEVRALLLRLPPRYHRALRHIVSAESRMTAAESKLTAQESRDALESMQIARGEVSLALRDVRGLLVSFLARRSEWNDDLQQTLNWSRSTGGTALIVDKLNHAAHLVQGGKDIRQFPVEFGPGWLDKKIRAGDQATPEGRYRIVSKKNGSRYYRALLLNYPNEEDLRFFRQLSRNGLISRGARPGGLIEIHGGGGKGEDWTFGCISLRNEHLDQLFPRIGVGTPVTIVGLWNEPPWLQRALQTASQ
jgi:hypothetical protein